MRTEFLSWARSVAGSLPLPLAPRPKSGDEAACKDITMPARSESGATLTGDQVRRMLEEALGADRDLARLLAHVEAEFLALRAKGEEEAGLVYNDRTLALEPKGK